MTKIKNSIPRWDSSTHYNVGDRVYIIVNNKRWTWEVCKSPYGSYTIFKTVVEENHGN